MPSPSSSTNRYASLARLLLRYGRSDLVSSAGLDEYDDGSDGLDGDSGTAEAFAADLEAMGPTFTKLGQLLSTRSDLLPTSYTEALSRLQDEVEPFAFEEVAAIVQDELGADVKHLFAQFDPMPLASASLGQVHRATLRTGREVVVKVQRPDAREIVRTDMQTLRKVAALADKGTSAGRKLGFEDLLLQFERSLAAELDYRREARNLLRFKDLTSHYDLLVVPEPVLELSTSRVLTMEYVEGRKVTDIGPLGLTDIDARPIVAQLFRAYLRSILHHGFLHADPHPGNLLVTPDGRLGVLDLGMVAHVPPRIQQLVVRLLVAISDDDGEQAATVLAELGHPLDDYDASAFRDEVTRLVATAVSQGPDLQAGRVLLELSRISGTHGLRPPAEMSMIGKALLNLDQSILHLDPEFAPAEAIRENVGDILLSGLTTSPGHLVTAALDTKEFTSQLPGRANRILEALANGNLRVQVDALDEERLHTVLQRVSNRLTLGLVIAATIIGSAMMIQVPTDHRILGYPAIAMLFLVAALVGGIALAVWIVVTDRRVARTELRPPKGDGSAAR
jgi:predicted unusual protein kinase regulating ubiquinone biosynthesis (AarF/ABC1/UbiB family)